MDGNDVVDMDIVGVCENVYDFCGVFCEVKLL